jgi:hypothetical protein
MRHRPLEVVFGVHGAIGASRPTDDVDAAQQHRHAQLSRDPEAVAA